MGSGAAYIGVAMLVYGEPPRVLLGALVLGVVYGLLAGLVVGVAAALVLALVSPALRREREARVAGAGAAVAGAVWLLYLLPGRFWDADRFVVVFLLVCAVLGLGVGRVVVFGARR
jgi:drug/metabolite transporter (DMT)-like permease